VLAHGTPPAEPTLPGVLLAWSFDPLPLVAVGAVAIGYVRAVREVNAAHPRSRVPASRAATFLGGLAAILLALRGRFRGQRTSDQQVGGSNPSGRAILPPTPSRNGTGRACLANGEWNDSDGSGIVWGDMDIDVPSAIKRRGDASPVESETAFTALVAEYHRDLVRLAYSMVGDSDLANDVAQSAWTAAWRNRRRLREPEKVRGWLLTIAANEARRSLRRRRRLWFIPLADDSGPTAAATQPDDRIDLVEALQRLRPRDREILARRYGLGETSHQIAEQVGMSDSGVRVRIGRLLDSLREELSK